MNVKMSKSLRVDFKLCTGCRTCTIVCTLKHEQQVGFQRSRIRVTKTLPRIASPVFKPVFCRMCRNAKCVAACPTGALVQDEATGLVDLDDAKCDGCGKCVQACPFDAIWLDEHAGVAVKCDLCGGDPTCVHYCTAGALIYGGN